MHTYFHKKIVYDTKIGWHSTFCNLFFSLNNTSQMSFHIHDSTLNHGSYGQHKSLFGCSMIYSKNPLLLGIQVVSMLRVSKGSPAYPGLFKRLKPDLPPLDPVSLGFREVSRRWKNWRASQCHLNHLHVTITVLFEMKSQDMRHSQTQVWVKKTFQRHITYCLGDEVWL